MVDEAGGDGDDVAAMAVRLDRGDPGPGQLEEAALVDAVTAS
jgi:hypothetical protein